jgi:hypothetical protein
VPASPGPRRRRRKLRAIDDIAATERSEFLREARKRTPFVAVEIEGATFIVRTVAGAEELPLFTRRSHPRLRRLEQVVSVLDELGLGDRARAGAFVEVGAGAGLATVAALAWHGFARAVACEADFGASRVLELNLVANRLQRYPVSPVQPGLIWIEDPRQVGNPRQLLNDLPPVVLRLGPARLPPKVLSALSVGHTHFVKLTKAECPRLTTLDSLTQAKTAYVLAVSVTAE